MRHGMVGSDGRSAARSQSLNDFGTRIGQQQKMPGSIMSVFSEPDDFQAALREDGFLNLLVTGSGQFRARLTQVRLHHLCLSAADEYLSWIVFFTVPEDMLLVSLPLSDRPSPVWGDLEMRAGEMITLGPGQRVSERTMSPGNGYGLMRRSLRRSRFAALAGALPLLAACAVQSQIGAMRSTEAGLQQFISATNDAVACRAAAARNPRYRVLDERMPLTDIGAASLRQMTDPRHASRSEIAALDAWSLDLDSCRAQLLQVAYNTVPSFGPTIESAGNDDDATFVQLAEHRITWGTAVLQMKINRTKLRSDLIARADEVVAELGKTQQGQLNRRTTILSSIIRIIP